MGRSELCMLSDGAAMFLLCLFFVLKSAPFCVKTCDNHLMSNYIVVC